MWESGRSWNHLGNIGEESGEASGSICKHMEPSGTIWEASGSQLKTYQNMCVIQSEVARASVSCERGEGGYHQVRSLRTKVDRRRWPDHPIYSPPSHKRIRQNSFSVNTNWRISYNFTEMLLLQRNPMTIRTIYNYAEILQLYSMPSNIRKSTIL